MIVQAAVRPAGGTFSAPADVSAPAGLRPMPRVAIDAAGNATVAWTQSDAAGMTVQAATRPGDGTFSAPVNLSTTGPTSYASQRIATNAAGETVAVWSGSDDANTIVEAATRPTGGVFSAPLDLSATGRDADSAQAAIDAAGNAVVVWTRFDGTSRVVQFAHRPAGGAFSAALGVSPAGAEARTPQVHVNAAGDAVVAWQRSDGTNTIIQATIRRAGATFAPATNLSLTGRDAVEPQVGIDADGDAIAVWQRSNGTNTIVQAAGYDGAGPQLRGLSIPAAVTAGTSATFSLSPLDVWSAITSTQWSFEDGASPTGASVSHVFTTPGEHTVTVTATDALGNANIARRTVTVTPPPKDPATTPAPPAPPVSPPPPPPAAAPTPTPPPPLPTPSNRFSVIKATARADGAIKLILRAPAPGAYCAVATSRRSGNRILAYGRGRANASRPGRVTLTIRPTPVAKRRLAARGARVAVAVTFKPTRGAARTKRLTVLVNSRRGRLASGGVGS